MEGDEEDLRLSWEEAAWEDLSMADAGRKVSLLYIYICFARPNTTPPSASSSVWLRDVQCKRVTPVSLITSGQSFVDELNSGRDYSCHQKSYTTKPGRRNMRRSPVSLLLGVWCARNLKGKWVVRMSDIAVHRIAAADWFERNPSVSECTPFCQDHKTASECFRYHRDGLEWPEILQRIEWLQFPDTLLQHHHTCSWGDHPRCHQLCVGDDWSLQETLF